MKAIISPAKKLDFKNINDPISLNTKLLFESDTSILVNKMKTLKPADISKLMSLSEDLSLLNFSRYQEFESAAKRAACFAFAGDTYQGLKINSFSDEDLEYAKDSVFILSGLYGLLRFNDPIKPYRLEMGIRLKTESNSNLYQFWDKKISQTLNEMNPQNEIILNLASNEYSKVIHVNELKAKIINVHFLQMKNNKLVSVGIVSKKARGTMARYLVQNKVKKLKELESFEFEGHKFNKELSNELELYYTK